MKTLDLDPKLNPDYTALVFDMPFKDDESDMMCALQGLEHLPFDDILKIFAEMVHVSRRYLLTKFTGMLIVSFWCLARRAWVICRSN